MCSQWCDRLLHQFQTDQVTKDCVLVSEDGTRVEGHRILLASVSGMLGDALSGHDQEENNEDVEPYENTLIFRLIPCDRVKWGESDIISSF